METSLYMLFSLFCRIKTKDESLHEQIPINIINLKLLENIAFLDLILSSPYRKSTGAIKGYMAGGRKKINF